MGQSNVDQPNNEIAVGFGPVVKAREIYIVPNTTEIGNKLKNPITSAIALLDVLMYTAEQTVDICAANTSTAIVAGLAANEAVVNSTGVYGYKPQSGDDIAVRKKGKFYLVNVVGVLAYKDKLIPSLTVAGAVELRAGAGIAYPSIGWVTKGNGGVAGGPVEAWIDAISPMQG